jgi:hypothetical protein
VRRFTLITLIVLFVMLAIAGIWQFRLAQEDDRFPGPTRGTPFPIITSLP